MSYGHILLDLIIDAPFIFTLLAANPNGDLLQTCLLYYGMYMHARLLHLQSQTYHSSSQQEQRIDKCNPPPATPPLHPHPISLHANTQHVPRVGFRQPRFATRDVAWPGGSQLP